MGNSATESKFNKDLWPIVYQGPFYNVLKNIKTNQEIQEYIQTFTNQDDFQRAKIIYDQRHNTPKNVVQFLGWEYMNDHRGACAIFKTAKIYTERILIRLEQVHNIPQEDCIFYMHESLQGDYVEITDTMIGFNKDEDIRVWINQEFSKNYPANQNHRQPGQNNEHRMVQKHFDVFQKHTLGKKWSNNFISLKQENLSKPYTFQETISFLEFYIQTISQINLNQNSQEVNKNKQMPRSFYQNSPLPQMQTKLYLQPRLMQSQTFPPKYYERNQSNYRNQQLQQNYPYQVSNSLTINQPMYNNIQPAKSNLLQSDVNEMPFRKFQTTKLAYNVDKQQHYQLNQKDNKNFKSKSFKSMKIFNPNQQVPQQTQIKTVTPSYYQPNQINPQQLKTNFHPIKISKIEKNQKKVDQRVDPHFRQPSKTTSIYLPNYPIITYNHQQNQQHQYQQQQYQPNLLNNQWKPKQKQFNFQPKNVNITKFNMQPFTKPSSQPHQISNHQRTMSGNQPMKMGENQQQIFGTQQKTITESNLSNQQKITFGSGGSHQFPDQQNTISGTYQIPNQQNSMGFIQQVNSQKMTGSFPNQQMTGQFPNQKMTGSFPSQQMTGQFPNQQMTGSFSNQQMTGQFTNQKMTGSFPNQQMTGQFTNQKMTGQFSDQKMTGSFPNQQMTGQFPDQKMTGSFPNQQMTGQFPNQQMTAEIGRNPINQHITNGTDKFRSQQMSMSGTNQIPSQQKNIGVNQKRQQFTEGYYQNTRTFDDIINKSTNQNMNFLVPHPSATMTISHIGSNN